MTTARKAALAAALSLAALSAAAPARAAGVPPYAGVGQRPFVAASVADAQRRNAAAISHVRSSIRSSQRNRF